MNRLQILCCFTLLFCSTLPAHGDQAASLRLVQTIPLPGVTGRLDHMAIDLEKRRLFVAAVANGSLEVVDLDAGGRWYGTPEASPGWVYVYQQQDADHYALIARVKTRPGSGTSLFVPTLRRLYVASQAIGDQAAAILVFQAIP